DSPGPAGTRAAPAPSAGPAPPKSPAPRRRKRAAPPVAAARVASGSSAAPLFSPERLMLGAGVIAGLLPLTHAHTWLTLMGLAFLLMLLTRQWKLWTWFMAPSCLLAAPQILWAISG